MLPFFVRAKRRVAEQFALHLGCMVYAVARSKEHLGEDYEPDLDGEFKPNMINSVVFLVQAVQQVRWEIGLVGMGGVGGVVLEGWGWLSESRSAIKPQRAL